MAVEFNLKNVLKYVQDLIGSALRLHVRDVTHGTSSAAACETVASETSFGITPDAGTADGEYSKGDHTHGTPTNPVTGHESTYAHANLPTAGEKAALPGTSGTPSGSNKYVTNDDSRNADARTPTAHGSAAHSGTIGAHSQLSGVGATDHHSNANDPTPDQKAALAGTDGTPSVTNKYVTNSDSRLGAGNPAAGVWDEETFTQATSSPHTICTPAANSKILEVDIDITVPATAGNPSVSVGVSGTVERDMAITDSDLTTEAVFIHFPYTAVGASPAAVILTITPDGQTFTGTVRLCRAVPG